VTITLDDEDERLLHRARTTADSAKRESVILLLGIRLVHKALAQEGS